MTPPPPEEPPREGFEDEAGEEPIEQPTEEQFAVEAELPPEEDPFFEGLPPEDLDVDLAAATDLPELDPEFREALLAAGGHEPTAEPESAEVELEPESAEAELEPESAEAELEPESAEAELVAEPDTEAPGVADEEAAGSEATAVHPLLGKGRQEVREALAKAAAEAEEWAPPRPPASGDFEPPPKRPRMGLRFMAASFLIVASMAAATATSVLLFISDVAAKLRPIPDIEEVLDSVEGGQPQTILILGSDRRAAYGEDRGLSDTTILLRLDPDRNAIALMSIPRDLQVEIPGYGTQKFNAAYSFGGPKLTTRMVKSLTGLEVNHLVNVDFLGFIKAINEIDCVYVDVDREYYHSNEGLPAELQYDEIDIDAGYQKLCGIDALDYVRYRHTDTDLVRAARQQDFLREARQRVPPERLLRDRTDLINIFTEYTSSDIDSLAEALDVLKLLIEARDAPIREIHFPAVLGPSYVYASRAAIHAAVDQFLGIEASGGPRGTLDTREEGDGGRGRGNRRNRDREGEAEPEQPRAPPTPTPANDGLVDAHEFGREIANQTASKLRSDFTVFYPQRLPSGTIYAEEPRVYHLQDTEDESRAAYKFVLQLPEGDYFGLQGIRDWENPPILNNPSETREINGREFMIFLDGDRVRLVGWTDEGNSYWVNNSLLQTLTNEQMLGIARSVGDVTPDPQPPRGRGN